jgi:hypothetical protein
MRGILYKVLFFIVLTSLVASCSSPSDKARTLIENDLKYSINDWLSYQFIEISKMDTTFSTPFDNKNYAKMCTMKDSLENVKFMLENPNTKKTKELDTQIKRLNQQIGNFEHSFKKEPVGWSCYFIFTSNNKLGTRFTSKYKYSFNNDITKITDGINLTSAENNAQER